MTRSQLEWFREMLEGYATTEVDIREAYSGRAMFNRQCLGVVLGDTKLIGMASVVLAMALDLDHNTDDYSDKKYDANEVIELLAMAPSASTDNMGYDIIVYWPSVSVEEADEED